MTGSLPAQEALFDFDNALLHASLPIDQTAGSIAAHFSATGQGYSIQNADVLGFTPAGFAGRCIYPNSISLADLLIRFDQTLTYFSIMYSVQELACDTSATMRVSSFRNGIFVGTNTKVASQPGTWPVDTLSCTFSEGFDSVVVHYDSHPPGCQDYGVIFMADNMRATPLHPSGIPERSLPAAVVLFQNYPNPFNAGTRISYDLRTRTTVTLRIFDMLGREVATPVHGMQQQGYHSVNFIAGNLGSGTYCYRLQAGAFMETRRFVLLK